MLSRSEAAGFAASSAAASFLERANSFAAKARSKNPVGGVGPITTVGILLAKLLEDLGRFAGFTKIRQRPCPLVPHPIPVVEVRKLLGHAFEQGGRFPGSDRAALVQPRREIRALGNSFEEG